MPLALENVATLFDWPFPEMDEPSFLAEVLEFLETPLPVYLFVPAPVWNDLRTRVTGPCQVAGRHHDLYRGWEVLVVTNK